MQHSNKAGYETLRDHFSDICESALEPSSLARGLFQKRLISAEAREAANQQHKTKANRLECLLDHIMASGSPGAFEDFVRLVGRDGCHSWLSNNLKGVCKCVCVSVCVCVFVCPLHGSSPCRSGEACVFQ